MIHPAFHFQELLMTLVVNLCGSMVTATKGPWVKNDTVLDIKSAGLKDAWQV